MEIKKKTLYKIIGISLILILGVTAWTLTKGTTENVTGNYIKTGELQEAELRFENYNYVLYPPELKEGVPARVTVDLSTVYGCMRDVIIPEYGIRKYVTEGDNIIEFTPQKSGEMGITCSMGMGQGSFKVSK